MLAPMLLLRGDRKVGLTKSLCPNEHKFCKWTDRSDWQPYPPEAEPPPTEQTR
jgi:hypothetical protein